MKKSDFIKDNIVPIGLAFLTIGMCVFSILAKVIQTDEFEHLYATLQVLHGQVPYRDFFEHHHPLMWYYLAPVIYFFQESVWTLYVARAAVVVFLFVTVFYVYRFAKLLVLPARIAVWAPLFYLTNYIVMSRGLDVRPDIPMICFYVMGAFYFFRYMQVFKQSDLSKSFFCFGISLLFLQKVLMLLLPIGVLAVGLMIRRRLTIGAVLKAAVLPAVVFLGVVGYFSAVDSFQNYFELNWLFNFEIGKNENFRSELKFVNGLFIAFLAVLSAIGLFLSEKKSLWRAFFFVSFVLILELTVCPTPVAHYWLPVYPFGAIVLLYFFQKILSGKWYEIGAAVYVMISATMICGWYNTENALTSNLELARFVLDHTNSTDVVLDSSKFNFYRSNALGYYWFLLPRVALLDVEKFHRHPLPDFNQILREEKPVIVYHFVLTDSWKTKVYDFDEGIRLAQMKIDENQKEKVIRGFSEEINFWGKETFVYQSSPIIQKMDLDYLKQHYTQVLKDIYVRNDRVTPADLEKSKKLNNTD